MEKIESISIDIETYSDRDLKKCGVYKYAESPNAELLLFGYSINNGPVTVIDVAQGEEVPEYRTLGWPHRATAKFAAEPHGRSGRSQGAGPSG